MKAVTKNITIEGEMLTLTNQRAIYWQKENALIVSDLHIGKTAHFRKHGIPMPDGILQKDLSRLKSLLLQFEVKKLIVVGDLFHAEANVDMKTFEVWLQQFIHIEMILVKGNHDRLSNKMMKSFNFQIETEYQISPFTFIHEPLKQYKNLFTISGHTHPGVIIEGKGKQRLKLPCYQISNSQIILPAFSLFTGLNTRHTPANSLCYAFTENTIFNL